MTHLYIVFIGGITQSLIYSFESKGFARFVRRQFELICLERSNEFLNLYLIQIFVFLYGSDLSLEALG